MCFKEDYGMIQGYLKKVQRGFKGNWKTVSKTFEGSFKESFSVFQECFNEVLFHKFVVAWLSSQLPEQKEGLLMTVRRLGQALSG